MTTIIFKESKKGNVKVAYDSCVTMGSRTEELEFDKVFVNAGHVFGVAGALRDSNIIRYADLPPIPDEEWDIDRWVVKKLVPALINALSTSYAAEYSNQQLSTENRSLVAVRGRVYEIGHDMSVCRNTDGIYVVGSGSAYVYGALGAGASIALALAVAAEYDQGTGEGLKLTSTARLLGEKRGNTRN